MRSMVFPPQRRARWLALAMVAAAVGGCGESTTPSGPAPDISGAWAFGQSLVGPVAGSGCKNQGTVNIHQTEASFTATYTQTGLCFGPGGTVDNSGSGTVVDGRLSGTAIQFSIPGCRYRGNIVGTPPDGATGTVNCQVSQDGQTFTFTGTWHVSHGVASVIVSPNPAVVGVTATLPLAATAYDASGNVLAREIVWASLTPTVATVDNGQARGGVTLGTAAITATTVPILPLEESVTGQVTVRVVYRFGSVAAGWLHSCGVLTGGGALCWGPGYDGRLGTGTTSEQIVPAPVTGERAFAGISGGIQHTCGVTTSGEAYCWGRELSGELGNGVASATEPSPVRVSGGLAFASVGAGNYFSCGGTTSGGGYCWGYGLDGRLGTGDFADHDTPVAVAGGLAFRMISTSKNAAVLPVGNGFACGVTIAGEGHCWGWNGEGELGNASTMSSSTPVAVAGGLTFAMVSAG